MNKAEDFISRHMLGAECVDEDKVLAFFLDEMRKGLAEEGGSSLAMIPTYIAPDQG